MFNGSVVLMVCFSHAWFKKTHLIDYLFSNLINYYPLISCPAATGDRWRWADLLLRSHPACRLLYLNSLFL